MEQPIGVFVQQYRKYYQAIRPILQKTKTKVYTTVVFFFLVLSLFGWYAIKPTIQTILYLQREIKDKTEVNKAMDDKIRALIEAQANYEQATPLFPLLEEAVPKAPNALALIAHIKSLAQNQHASVSGIQISNVPLTQEASTSATEKKQTPQEEFQITITVEGSYQSLKTFIDELTSMRRIIQIASVNFTPIRPTSIGTASASIKTQTIRLIMQLVTYYNISKLL